MENKSIYESPATQTVYLSLEGVICGSFREMNFGDSNRSGTISDDDIFDGGAF